MTPEAYFNLNNLYDRKTLAQHCEYNLVHMIESTRYPNVVMLHYKEEVHFDKQWTTFNRMCRGLMVDLANKKILAYPFDKFFNLDEMPETSHNVLNTLGSFEVSEKLDGSLLILFKDPNTGEFRMTTKGSLDSEHGVYASSLIPESLKNDILTNDYTLMFELISSQFQIVIDYKKKGYSEGLYLIGVRQRNSDKLLSYGEVQFWADRLGLKSFQTYQFSTLDSLIDNVKDLSILEEGYVLKYGDLLVKVKGDRYLAAHRFISKLSPKYILESLGNGTTDDLLHVAPEEYRQDVEDAIFSFTSERQVIEDDCLEYFTKAPKTTRKEFALWVQKEVPDYYRGFLFTLMDDKPLDKKKVYTLVGDRNGISGKTKI